VYFAHVLEKDDGWNFILGIYPEEFIQDIQGEPEGDQPTNGLTSTSAMRSSSIYFTT
jgi:hypothetical protein